MRPSREKKGRGNVKCVWGVGVPGRRTKVAGVGGWWLWEWEGHATEGRVSKDESYGHPPGSPPLTLAHASRIPILVAPSTAIPHAVAAPQG